MEDQVKKRGRKKGDGLGKTGGRQPGSQNKVTKETKEMLVALADKNSEKAQKMLDMIVDPKEWFQCYLKLCEFVVAKKAAVSTTVDVKQSDLRSELQELAQKEID